MRRALLTGLLVLAAAPAGAAAATCGPADAPGGEWPLYGATLDNHREQTAETAIGPDSVADLATAFKTPMPDGGVIQSTPTVVGGCIFTGTDLGDVFAFNADTGELVWERELQGGGGNAFVGAGIIGAPVVANGLVYVAATAEGRSLEAALDQTTGEVVWTQLIDSDSGGGADASPVPFGDLLFQSYQGDESSDHSNPGFVIMDATREGGGRILAHTKIIPAADYAAGDRGGSITATSAVDLEHGLLYAVNGNPASGRQHPRTNSMLKIDVDRDSATFGQVLESWRGDSESYPAPQDVDSPTCRHDLQWPLGPLSCTHTDMDFLASPNLFTHSDGRLLLGALQKSGVYHVIDTATMQEVWKATIGVPCLGCNLSSTAVDAEHVYVAVSGGNLYALDRDTGTPAWAVPATGGTHFEGVSVANGVVYTLNDAGALEAIDAATGVPLTAVPFMRETQEPMQDLGNSSGIAIARDTVYVSAKNTSTSTLFAYRLGAGGGGGGGGPQPPPVPDVGAGGDYHVLSGPGASTAGYLTPFAVAAQGGTLTYTNADIVRHDVVSDQPGLFSSVLISAGQSAEVAGVPALAAGQYGFHCSLHTGMKGTLIIQ